jgi:radical SAM-linked protein
MTETIRYRYRLRFAKTIDLRFTGHLDLHRALERTLRRASLPLAYTQGFNPRPRLNLASALPLGFTSECELADFWFEEELPANQILADLQLASPPGLQILALEQILQKEPSLQKQVIASEYEVQIRQQVPLDTLQTRVHTLLAADSLLRKRRGKEYDLRPLIEALSADAEQHGQPRLTMRLSNLPGATGRPEEVLHALDLDPACALVTRKQLILHS